MLQQPSFYLNICRRIRNNKLFLIFVAIQNIYFIQSEAIRSAIIMKFMRPQNVKYAKCILLLRLFAQMLRFENNSAFAR